MKKDNLIRRAKETVEKDGEHSPLFFIIRPNNQMDIVSMMIGEDSTDASEALKQLVIERESEEYYSVFSAWMVNGDDVSKQIKEVIEEAQKNPTKEIVRDTVMRVAELATQRPSQNPAKIECLIVAKYSKTNGTEVDVFPYTAENSKFKEWIDDKEIAKAFDGRGSMYSKWNAWHEYEINLDDYIGK